MTTPCTGLCTTMVGDDVCRGCYRYAQEVTDWNGYSAVERLRVLGRIAFLQRQAKGRAAMYEVACALYERQVRNEGD